jgi:hypothetical protein
MWADMTTTYLIGLCFFDGPVSTASCAEILGVWLILQLRDREDSRKMWLYPNGADAHFALSVRSTLNEHSFSHCIGSGSLTSPTPLSWPPCSSDLTAPDNSLWGVIKGQVAMHCYCSNELCRAVQQTFTTITPQMLYHMFVTQNMAAHQAGHRTQQCTYRST